MAWDEPERRATSGSLPVLISLEVKSGLRGEVWMRGLNEGLTPQTMVQMLTDKEALHLEDERTCC